MQPLFIIDLFICIISLFFFFYYRKTETWRKRLSQNQSMVHVGFGSVIPLVPGPVSCVLNLSAILPLLQMSVLYSLLVAYVMVASCF